MYTHWRNHQLIKELEGQNFFADVFEKNIEAVATVGNFSLALRIGEKLNEVINHSLSTAKRTIKFGHSLPCSTGNRQNEQSRTKNSLISNTTTSRRPAPMLPAISSPPTVLDTTDSSECSNIYSNSKENMSQICSILKTSPGSTHHHLI
jgi:hypothetical protein